MEQKSTLMMIDKEAFEAVRKLRRDNDSRREELMKAKQMELSCQRCKDQLMKKRSQMTTSIQSRCAELEDVTARLSASSRKLFEQLYSPIDEIHQLELLMLELNQQLLLAKAAREEETVLKALRGEQWTDQASGADSSEDWCILRQWFQQISCLKNTVDPDVPPKSSQKDCGLHNDRVFYWARYDEESSSYPNGHRTLSFSTRHCGICLRLHITAPRCIGQGTSKDHPVIYTVTSDLPLEGLQFRLQRSVEERQMAHEFVIKTVWRLMEEQLVPLVSS